MCDADGFLLGTWLHWSIPDGTANVVKTAVLVGLGVYWLGIALYARRLAETRWVWALPFVLSIDNITYGLIDHAWSSSVAVQAIEQLISSSLLALVGLIASAAVLRAIPEAEAAEHRVPCRVRRGRVHRRDTAPAGDRLTTGEPL